MFRLTRAIGYAVAGTLVAASPTFATPTLISAPLPATYLSHTVATPALDAEPAALDANAVDMAAAQPDGDVAEHAQAAIPPSPEQMMPEGRSLGELVTTYSDTALSDDEQECLAGAIYFEAKGEPLEGQLAVAEVVLNRSKSGRFPSSICGVVKQPSQFSFIRKGRFPPIQRSSAAWRKAIAIAHVAMSDLAASRADTALFFHATYVSPSWRGLKRVAQVGNHIFYR